MECTLGKESPALKQLKQLSNSLPTLKDLLIEKSPGRASYRVKTSMDDNSLALAETLLSEPGVAVMRFSMKKGDTLEYHKHSENEWIIVISGSFVTYINGTKQTVEEGGYVYYPSYSSHGGIILEDVDCICITVPKAEGYPDAN